MIGLIGNEFPANYFGALTILLVLIFYLVKGVVLQRKHPIPVRV